MPTLGTTDSHSKKLSFGDFLGFQISRFFQVSRRAGGGRVEQGGDEDTTSTFAEEMRMLLHSAVKENSKVWFSGKRC